MNAKHFIKKFLPPILVDLARQRLSVCKFGYTWEGIYSHIGDVPVELNSYNNSARVQEFLAHVNSLLALTKAGRKPNLGWHEPLMMLAATVSARQHRLCILDFGGGLGEAYIHLLGTLKIDTTIEYHVVDLEMMCAAGQQLFAHDSRIQFQTSFPTFREGFDIVYASGVLPYIADYAGLLRELATFKAPYILLTQLAAGKFPTYATRQLNLSGQVLAYWFINLEEIVGILADTGYTLVHDGQHGREYDQNNFPETHRLGRMRSLLFVRATELLK